MTSASIFLTTPPCWAGKGWMHRRAMNLGRFFPARSRRHPARQPAATIFSRRCRPLASCASCSRDAVETSSARSRTSVDQILRAAAAQNFHAFRHFERVADRAAERFVHRAEQRRHLHAHQLPHFRHGGGELLRFRARFHERAARRISRRARAGRDFPPASCS